MSLVHEIGTVRISQIIGAHFAECLQEPIIAADLLNATEMYFLQGNDGGYLGFLMPCQIHGMTGMVQKTVPNINLDKDTLFIQHLYVTSNRQWQGHEQRLLILLNCQTAIGAWASGLAGDIFKSIGFYFPPGAECFCYKPLTRY